MKLTDVLFKRKSDEPEKEFTFTEFLNLVDRYLKCALPSQIVCASVHVIDSYSGRPPFWKRTCISVGPPPLRCIKSAQLACKTPKNLGTSDCLPVRGDASSKPQKTVASEDATPPKPRAKGPWHNEISLCHAWHSKLWRGIMRCAWHNKRGIMSVAFKV